MTKKPTKKPDTQPGRFYGWADGGRLVELRDQPPGRDVDAWICRRVADYAPAPVPAGAAFDACTRCAARIAYNPARRVAAPRVCMQCAGIAPLPMPRPGE